MRRETALNFLLSVCCEADKIALEGRSQLRPRLKSDGTIVTDTDLAISNLLRARLAACPDCAEHLLIDEESQDSVRFFHDRSVERAEFVWAIDPIDGTKVYANGQPQYGVSIGLLRRGEPWLGAVLFPSLRELFLEDGECGWFIEDPFGPNEQRTQILPVARPIDGNSFFMGQNAFITRLHWTSRSCQLLLMASSVAACCWPLIGRACGSLFTAHLWDLAGSWPLLKRAGFAVIDRQTEKELCGLELDAFRGGENNPWRFKHDYLICRPEDFTLLSSMIRERARK